MDTYVARQPIFNLRKKIFAYELLFRNGTENAMGNIDGDSATKTVLANSFFSIGLDTILGGKKGFVNFTSNLLINKVPLLLPKKSIVVEVLENVDPTPELVEACRLMAQKGYTLALDDFVYNDIWRPLLEIAHIIKFDLRQSTFDQIKDYISRLDNPGLKLLAEKVETHAEFTSARKMGFEFFQGYFFCKPEIVQGKEIPGAKINLLQLMAKINQPDFDFDQLEKVIERDVSLFYKLLRYINSAFFAKSHRISSIKQALVYMGQAEIRRFVSLIAMSNLAAGKPNELIRASCIRAKFCELMPGDQADPVMRAELFTLGIFSLIDAIMDQPMAAIMEALPLADSIRSALVDQSGPLYPYLMLAEAYERGKWKLVGPLTAALKLENVHLPSLYLDACKWADSLAGLA